MTVIATVPHLICNLTIVIVPIVVPLQPTTQTQVTFIERKCCKNGTHLQMHIDLHALWTFLGKATVDKISFLHVWRQ